MSGSQTVEVEGRTLTVTNLDRVLWPATGFSKGGMIDYYRAIGPVLVPHVVGRPVMLGRFPAGVEGRAWGQLACRGRPDWMATTELTLRTGVVRDVCLVNDVASLMWVANQGVIELHPFLARAETFNRPTAMDFDLDPGPPAGLAECARVALALRRVLEAEGRDAVVKTSGSAGLHAVIPLNGAATYGDTKGYARAAAARLAAEQPDLVLDRMTRSLRAGKVFVDWAQNDERKQTVAAYSLRATAVPGVSTPVTWDEVEHVARTGDASALVFSPRDVLERVERLGDVFRGVSATPS